MISHIKIKTGVLISCLIFACQIAFSDSNNIGLSSSVYKLHYGSIPVLILSGNYKKMGREYGDALQTQLYNELYLLKQYYMGKGVSYSSMIKQANLLYNRFPLHYQDFLKGEAHGSGLTFNEVKILNAMETLGELLPHHQDVK